MGYDLVRTPQAGILHGIVTSDDLIVVDTHYWHGRTTPCERPSTDENGNQTGGECQPCNEAIPYRTHVYVSLFQPQKNQHSIFECTAHAAKALDDYRNATGTLRGCTVHATRPKGKPNSQVVLDCQPTNLQRVNIPSAPNLQLALSVIWHLPLTGLAIQHEKGRLDPNTPGPHRERPTVHTRPEPIRNMREVPDNAKDPPTVAEVLAGNGQQKRKPVHA
jgi:hypothetical protein